MRVNAIRFAVFAAAAMAGCGLGLGMQKAGLMDRTK